jgi:ubiquinone/menaquinone biosynthesis C-methylase UbiE
MPDADRREGDTYVLGRTVEEYERLRAQARMYEEATRRTLEKAGIALGMRCLDAGSGPGEVMRLMGGMVGPGGFVSGIDLDENLGRLALRQLHESEGPYFAFHQGDLARLKDAPDGPYDLVYTRLTLFHIDDPAAVLRTLWSWLKPGGVLVAMDFDTGGVGSFPDPEVAREIIRVINETMTKAGRDIHIGARLPHLFVQAGIAPIAGTDVASHLLPLGEIGGMPRAILRSLREPAVKLGVASEAEIARIDQAFAARMSDPSIYLLAPLIISTWARKPG